MALAVADWTTDEFVNITVSIGHECDGRFGLRSSKSLI
jgi:hypothetical protein